MKRPLLLMLCVSVASLASGAAYAQPSPWTVFTKTATPARGAAAITLPRGRTKVPTSGTFLYLNSQPGDYIGGGIEQLYTSMDSTISGSLPQNSDTFSGSVNQDNFTHWWYVNIAAPRGIPLAVGSYEGAVRAPFRPPGTPGLDVYGDGRGCNTLTGRFDVNQLSYTPSGDLSVFDATFEQHCEGAPAALFGRMRIDNTPEPPPLVITTNTTLTSDHQGPVVIGADDITLDCAGHTISGPGQVGIDLTFRTGVTVKRCMITGFSTALFVSQSVGNNTFVGNLASEGGDGFTVDDADRNTFEANRAENNTGRGFFVFSGSANTFVANQAQANEEAGFRVDPGFNNVFTQNSAVDNGAGFALDEGSTGNTFNGNVARANHADGFNAQSSSRNVFTKNTAEANYGNGFQILAGSSGNTLTGNVAKSNSAQGFMVSDANTNVLASNKSLQNTGFGFLVEGSSGNTLQGNEADEDGNGFVIDASKSNRFTANVATAGGAYGFAINASNGNTFLANRAEGNTTGNGFGVGQGSSNNAFTRNVAQGNRDVGFWVDSGSSDNNFSDNTAAQNGIFGFFFDASNGNTHGNLINSNQAQGNGNGFVVNGGSGGNTYTANTARANGNGGFLLLSTDGNTLNANTSLQNAADGFVLAGSSGNTLTGNVANWNGNIGFDVVTGSGSNALRRNQGCTNHFLDALDDRTGTGDVWVGSIFCRSKGI